MTDQKPRGPLPCWCRYMPTLSRANTDQNQVQCPRCGRRGSVEKTEAQAIAEWNKDREPTAPWPYDLNARIEASLSGANYAADTLTRIKAHVAKSGGRNE